ncbi:hypothetical protein FDA94_09420 [Herbidospora galbida]|uniref:Uncharacterized protein n=1 Tax=Herbidospora galbida TaxID=2575442 RepID=A0A4U3MNI7_9ACTN|nr:hypothetical protein [Herbidospora galbida]TKK89596.1 hypothetical protein FDA94_09420 [Herbidospora galbida]
MAFKKKRSASAPVRPRARSGSAPEVRIPEADPVEADSVEADSVEADPVEVDPVGEVPPLRLWDVPQPAPLPGPASPRQPGETLTDADRRSVNYQRDLEFFQALWEVYYDGATGARDRSMSERMLYGLMSTDDPLQDADYLREPLGEGTIAALASLGLQTSRFSVFSQDDPDLLQAAAAGDYFHVANLQHPFDPARNARRARRLAVNVRSQETALTLAMGLTTLFGDAQVGPYFEKLKVFLSETPADSPVKTDKLMLYYLTAADAQDGGPDVVGDRLLTAINSLLPPGEGVMLTSPFYSRVATAVTWSEDAQHFMPGAEGMSFTDTRATLIREVLDTDEPMPNPEALAQAVFDVFEVAGVPWNQRHRHTIPDQH